MLSKLLLRLANELPEKNIIVQLMLCCLSEGYLLLLICSCINFVLGKLAVDLVYWASRLLRHLTVCLILRSHHLLLGHVLHLKGVVGHIQMVWEALQRSRIILLICNICHIRRPRGTVVAHFCLILLLLELIVNVYEICVFDYDHVTISCKSCSLLNWWL